MVWKIFYAIGQEICVDSQLQQISKFSVSVIVIYFIE